MVDRIEERMQEKSLRMGAETKIDSGIVGSA